MPAHRPLRPAAALALAVAAAAAFPPAAGTASPATAPTSDTLKTSVQDLDLKGGTSAIKSQVQTIKTNADDVVSSAKSDFPTQTSAISRR